jgi:hypothetical protein
MQPINIYMQPINIYVYMYIRYVLIYIYTRVYIQPLNIHMIPINLRENFTYIYIYIYAYIYWLSGSRHRVLQSVGTRISRNVLITHCTIETPAFSVGTLLK